MPFKPLSRRHAIALASAVAATLFAAAQIGRAHV